MDIFKALKRAFSTGMIVNHTSNGQVKVIDTQRSQAYSRRHNDFFSKLRKGLIYNTSLSQNYVINRLALYRDYDMMDTDPIVHAVLDVYVFEAFTKNQMGQVLNITSDDQEIAEALHQLFYGRLNCQFNFGVWFRTLLKYGDSFVALKLDQQLGIYGCSPISSYDIERVQDQDSDNYSFKLSTMGGQKIENYNIAHFRMMTDPNFLPYGASILQSARRIWKNFNLMVDAMLIQRIMRAPERRVFKIDVGDIPQDEVTPYMTDIINKMKKVPYRDPNTGQINLRYNMMNLLQDFYIPVRGVQDGSSIDTLAGMENSFTEDIQFIKSYMLAAFKVPKAFLTFEQGIQAKSTLSQLDIIFGRAVQQYQTLFVNQLYKIALVHLFMLGYTDVDSLDFKLSLNNPSIVKQLQDIDFWNQKVQLGQRMEDSKQFSRQFIYKYIYKMSQQQINHQRVQLFKDQVFNVKQQQITSEEVNDIDKLQTIVGQIYAHQDVVDNIINKAQQEMSDQRDKSNSQNQDTPEDEDAGREQSNTDNAPNVGSKETNSDNAGDGTIEEPKHKIKITKVTNQQPDDTQDEESLDSQGKPRKKTIKISRKGRPKSNQKKRTTELPQENNKDRILNVSNAPLEPVFNGKSPLATK